MWRIEEKELPLGCSLFGEGTVRTFRAARRRLIVENDTVLLRRFTAYAHPLELLDNAAGDSSRSTFGDIPVMIRAWLKTGQPACATLTDCGEITRLPGSKITLYTQTSIAPETAIAFLIYQQLLLKIGVVFMQVVKAANNALGMPLCHD